MTDLSRTMFVGVGTSAPCWYRCALPAMHLGAEWCGVRGEPPHLAFVTGMSSRMLDVEELFGYETVVLQQPRGGAWMNLIRKLQAAGITVLYEIDDDVHAVRKVAGHANAGKYPKRVLADVELAMRACDGLIVSTDVLAQRYRTLNPNVWVCRNGLDLGRFSLTRPAREHVTIGWSGGTGHQEAVLPWLDAVRNVMRDHAHVRFMSAGEPYATELEAEFGPERATSLPFIDIDSYPAALANFDIAIAPAGRGNFHRAKSDLRWLEASALAIPTVADPFVYDEVEHGVTGFLAESATEAEGALRRLVDDAGERERIGTAAREHLLAHRSMKVSAGQWTQAIGEAREQRPAALAS